MLFVACFPQVVQEDFRDHLGRQCYSLVRELPAYHL